MVSDHCVNVHHEFVKPLGTIFTLPLFYQRKIQALGRSCPARGLREEMRQEGEAEDKGKAGEKPPSGLTCRPLSLWVWRHPHCPCGSGGSTQQSHSFPGSGCQEHRTLGKPQLHSTGTTDLKPTQPAGPHALAAGALTALPC